MNAGVYDRILEEAACVADDRRVGQLCAPNLANCIEHVGGRDPALVCKRRMALQVRVGQSCLPLTRQAKLNGRNDPAAGFLLESAVSIGKRALIGRKHHHFRRIHVPGSDGVQSLGHFQAIGSDVLNRRRADIAGDQGQIFQPTPPLRQRMAHELMPGLTGCGFHDVGLPRGIVLWRSTQPGDAAQIDVRNQIGDFFTQYEIAASAQSKPFWMPSSQRAECGQLAHVGNGDEGLGQRPQSQRVASGEILRMQEQIEDSCQNDEVRC